MYFASSLPLANGSMAHLLSEVLYWADKLFRLHIDPNANNWPGFGCVNLFFDDFFRIWLVFSRNSWKQKLIGERKLNNWTKFSTFGDSNGCICTRSLPREAKLLAIGVVGVLGFGKSKLSCGSFSFIADFERRSWRLAFVGVLGCALSFVVDNGSIFRQVAGISGKWKFDVSFVIQLIFAPDEI